MFLPRLAACLAALVLSASATLAAPPAERGKGEAEFFRKLKSGEPVTVVVYGTSLTKGGAWTVALRDWLLAKDPGKVHFINSGGPGQNSEWGVQNLQAKVMANHPDLVFLEFAFNDAHDKFKLPVTRGTENLVQMVTTLQTQRPPPSIVLQVMNKPWDAPNNNGSASHRPQLEAFNDNYRRYAQEQGLTLLDHYPAWRKLQETDQAKFEAYLPDGTHPSKEGSLAVTWPAIQAWLEKGLVP